MKFLFAFIFLFFGELTTYGQSEKEDLSIDMFAEVPDSTINHVSNYNSTQLKFSDFKGKLILLDFWGVYCKPCIGAFPKLDSLAKEFRESLEIILVNSSSQTELDSLLYWGNRVKKITKKIAPYLGSFISVTEDTKLKRWFPHVGIPHYVWISPEGKLIGKTTGEEVTFENIKAVLKGNYNVLSSQKLITINPDRNIIYQLEQLNEKNNIGYYSLFTKYIPGLSGVGPRYEIDSIHRKITLRRVGLSKLDFIGDIFGRNAYGNPFNNPAFDYGKRLYLQTPDSSTWFYKKGEGLSKQEWVSQNKYIYEAVYPTLSMEQAYKWYQEDVEKCLGIQAEMQVKMKKCISIIKVGEDHRFHFSGKREKGPRYYFNDEGGFIINEGSMETLRQALSKANRESEYLFLDQTDYTGKIKLKLDSSLSDIPALKKELRQKYDLDLKVGIEKIPILVVKD